jgi:hypothetical protein
MNRPDEVTIYVKGGFPLVVELYWCPAEPDVGLPYPYYEIVKVMTESRRNAAFLGVSDEELDKAIERALR